MLSALWTEYFTFRQNTSRNNCLKKGGFSKYSNVDSKLPIFNVFVAIFRTSVRIHTMHLRAHLTPSLVAAILDER